jgi:hypothetical protein
MMNTPRRTFIYALGLTLATAASFYTGRADGARSAARAQALRPAAAAQSPLARSLRERFGPTRNSSNLEEWIVRDFFQDKRGGVFVDVGANHHQERSNTYYLETALGWSGVAIEPLAQFAEGYKRFRPRTTFVPLFVSDVSDHDAILYVPTEGGNNRVASQNRAFTESFGVAAEPTHVRTKTLDNVLDRRGIRAVD